MKSLMDISGIGKPVETIQKLRSDVSIGISCPHVVIPISILAGLPTNGCVPLPFKEVEYLHLNTNFHTPIYFHFALDHMEQRIGDPDQPTLPTSLSWDFPLLHSLKILVVVTVPFTLVRSLPPSTSVIGWLCFFLRS